MTEEAVPWWEEGGAQEESSEEVVRCDDTPETAVCEFDAYDGICWHCKNMVHPDVHLIHLISNRRTAHRLLEPFLESHGDGWEVNLELEEALDRILSPLEERDITSHPNLSPEDRVKALQEMDDREYILSELEASFPDWKERAPDGQFDLDPDGFGLGNMINRLYDDIHHFNQEDWDPEWAAEWGLGEALSGELGESPGEETEMHPVGWVIGVGYLWFVFQFIMEDPEVIELMANEIGVAITLGPLWLIRQIFARKVEEPEEKGEEAVLEVHLDRQEEGGRKMLIVSTIGMGVAMLLPWGGWWTPDGGFGSYNGLDHMRGAPDQVGFLLSDGLESPWLTGLGWLDWFVFSVLSLVFVLTFAVTWYKHEGGDAQFGKKASSVHLSFFGAWLMLYFLNYGTFPVLDFHLGVLVAGISGIGLDPSMGERLERYGKPS